MTRATEDVLAERQRQIDKEGWSAEHDDQHSDRSLAQAPVCYTLLTERNALAEQVEDYLTKCRAASARAEKEYQFGRCGKDDMGWWHGKRDCLEDVIEEIEGIIQYWKRK